MKKYIGIRYLFIYIFIILGAANINAQNNVPSQDNSSVRNTKTDKKYGNTTEVYKKEGATDTDILSEIEKDYGLGDVVRITVAPPPLPPVETLATTQKPLDIKKDNFVIPSFSTIGTNNTEKKDIEATPSVSIPNSRTSTYSNTDKDNNRPPLVSSKNPKVSTQGAVDEPIASATPRKKVAADMPPIIENPDMVDFNKSSVRESTIKKTKVTTSSKGSAKKATTSKNYRSGSNKSYKSGTYKKNGWFASLFSKNNKPSRRKVSSKEPGCYRF